MPLIVILDLEMPGGMPGLEVLGRIRHDERTRLLPVVVLTSSRSEDDLVRSYELGANSYIQKPLDFESFLDAIKALGIYWILWNEDPQAGQRRRQ